MAPEKSLEEHLISFKLTERIIYFTTLVSVQNLATEKLFYVKPAIVINNNNNDNNNSIEIYSIII